MKDIHRYAIASVLSVALTSILTSAHHIFRLGFTSLPIWMPVIMLPIMLIKLFQRSRFKNNYALAAYAFVSYAIIFWFGMMDALLDHSFRVLGWDNFTWLPGGDVEIVQTAFEIISPEFSHWIFQISGAIVFPVSLIALYFTTRFLMARMAFDKGKKKAQVSSQALTS